LQSQIQVLTKGRFYLITSMNAMPGVFVLQWSGVGRRWMMVDGPAKSYSQAASHHMPNMTRTFCSNHSACFPKFQRTEHRTEQGRQVALALAQASAPFCGTLHNELIMARASAPFCLV